jgi:hypothetical protein
MKFNLFLFTTSGRMVSSITNSEVLYIRDIQSGNYILEIFGINNEFKYRYIVNVEN